MTARRLKLLTILCGLALGALTLLSWTQPWFEISLTSGEGLAVSGQIAAPALSALALASLALLAALSIAGRVFRVVLGSVQFVIGALVLASAAGAIANPLAASLATVTEAVGESGSTAAAGLVASLAVTAWPWVAAISGGLEAALGLSIILTGGRWPGPTRKYDPNAPVDDSAVGHWDSLSAGGDPTDGAVTPSAPR